MSPHRRSRFVFEIRGRTRTFMHQVIHHEQTTDCPSCRNQVASNEPFSHHWIGSQDVQHLKLGLDEKLLLQRIERQHIDTFLLCDESAANRTSDFLLEAGERAVPLLLRFLSYEVSRLEVTIGFYVNVLADRMYYESAPVAINHFLDIGVTVDVIFSLLLEKIYSYVSACQRVPLDACTIKRLKVTVRRQCNGQQLLPLQYRVKTVADPQQLDGASSSSGSRSRSAPAVDLGLLTESFLKYQGQRFGQFPPALIVNIYCLRVCASTKELYAVPYLLRSQDVAGTPSFLIQTDVAGEFRGLYEIRDVRRFLRPDSKDNVFVCRHCSSHFSERLECALHKLVDCGSGFVVYNLDSDATELHENCLPLPKEFFNYAWYGIGP
ncbi:hypothetical protein KR222_002195 [Zaprionus bogoriensis]|nr:hypothetical protein KR222_002195 [Zaprionus bogoriensis]